MVIQILVVGGQSPASGSQPRGLALLRQQYRAEGGIPMTAPSAIREFDALAADDVPVTTTKAQCQPGDLVETGLQGQVPIPDRLDGRAARGYHCNLAQVGAFGARRDDPTQQWTTGWANFDTYKNCAYYSDGLVRSKQTS
jgi:hypothetical protein